MLLHVLLVTGAGSPVTVRWFTIINIIITRAQALGAHVRARPPRTVTERYPHRDVPVCTAPPVYPGSTPPCTCTVHTVHRHRLHRRSTAVRLFFGSQRPAWDILDRYGSVHVLYVRDAVTCSWIASRSAFGRILKVMDR